MTPKPLGCLFRLSSCCSCCTGAKSVEILAPTFWVGERQQIRARLRTSTTSVTGCSRRIGSGNSSHRAWQRPSSRLAWPAMKSAVSRSWPSAAWIIRDAATAIRRRMDAHVLDDMAAGPEPHAVGVGVHVPVGQASSSAGSPSRVAKAPCYPSSVDAGWLPSRPASTSWRQGLWWIARSAA